MSDQVVAIVYRQVIEDVMEQMQQAFLDEGTDESVLQELKELWMAKLADHGTSSESGDASQAFERGRAGIAAASGMAASAPGYPLVAVGQSFVGHAPSYSLQTTLPQGDGAADSELFLPPPALVLQRRAPLPSGARAAEAAAAIAQRDGGPDDEDVDDDTFVSDEEGQASARESGLGESVPPVELGGGASSASLDDLNSEDDDEEVKEHDTEEEETDNFIICQYEKIARTKNKYRATLKDGIMSLNGKEYMFQRAAGEYDW